MRCPLPSAWLLALLWMGLVASEPEQPATSGLLLRLRANKLRRPELCRDSLPRRADELPALVVTGRVREVYQPAQEATATATATAAATNRALVRVGRVLKGGRQLAGADILIAGFNSSSSPNCPNHVKPNDSLILLLEPSGRAEPENSYALHRNNLLAMNLANLDRVNALVNEEAPRRRGPIEDILCEALYCPYGRCQVVPAAGEEVGGQQSSAKCQCPESCPPRPPAPVCGSDNATYPDECHLIREGCRLRRPLFVTKESAC